MKQSNRIYVEQASKDGDKFYIHYGSKFLGVALFGRGDVDVYATYRNPYDPVIVPTLQAIVGLMVWTPELLSAVGYNPEIAHYHLNVSEPTF